MKHYLHYTNNKVIGYSTCPCDNDKFECKEVDEETFNNYLQTQKIVNGYKNELNELINWFDTYYSIHEQKYRRLHSLGKLTDEGKDAYSELINLYNEAEIKRARIQELERLLSDNSK